MEALTAGDEIAVDFLRPAILPEPDLRFLRFQVVDGNGIDLEQQWSPISEAALNQVFYNLLLAVNRDTLVHQRIEVEAVKIAVDPDIDAPMQHTLALHALADSHIGEQVGGPMFYQPGADAIFDIVATAILDDD